jgi:hypothetical protein
VDHGSDRRRYERFTFTSQLEVRTPGQLHWTQARACDVSIGGLSFITDTLLAVGDQIRLGLPNPEGTEFILDATVRYVRADQGRYIIGAERRAN